MKFDKKSIENGLTESVMLHLFKRTKHRNAKIECVHFHKMDKFGNFCLKLNIVGGFRNEITLHINKSKLTKIKRDLLLNELLK